MIFNFFKRNRQAIHQRAVDHVGSVTAAVLSNEELNKNHSDPIALPISCLLEPQAFDTQQISRLGSYPVPAR